MGETTISCRITSLCVLIVFCLFVFAKFHMPTPKISRHSFAETTKICPTHQHHRPATTITSQGERLPAELREASLDNIFFLFPHKFHDWMEINVKKNALTAAWRYFWILIEKRIKIIIINNRSNIGLVFGCNNRLHFFHLHPPLNHHRNHQPVDSKEIKKTSDTFKNLIIPLMYRFFSLLLVRLASIGKRKVYSFFGKSTGAKRR